MNYKTNLFTRLNLLMITFLLGNIVAFAQGSNPGGEEYKYEGTVKTPDEKVSVYLRSLGGKLSGQVTRGAAAMDVTDWIIKDGTVTVSFGKEGSLTAKIDGDKFVGNWMEGKEKRALELTTVRDNSTTAAAPAPVNLNGNWEAIADANGQTVPFLLTLKVDGETVTGSSSSQLGEATIKGGSFKGGRLIFDLEGASGVISMSAVVIDGKLSGEFDFAGQAQGKWVAVKKN